MKTVLAMVFLLAGVPAVQSQTPKPLGVSIEGWRYEPQAKVVILHLVNNSHKDVTASGACTDVSSQDECAPLLGLLPPTRSATRNCLAC